MAPLPPRSTVLQQFFTPVGDSAEPQGRRPYGRPTSVKVGSLISFGYAFWKNDPYPLMIVIDNEVGKDKISGINLHYLTFRDIRDIISKAGKMGFSYRSVSANRPFRSSYRSYKRAGVRQMRVLDPAYLMGVIGMVRSFDPADAQIVRRQVQEQLRQQINPKASQTANLDQPGDEDVGTGG